MFLNKLVNKIFHNKEAKKRKKGKHDGVILSEEKAKVILQTGEIEITKYENFDENNIIDDYIDCFSARTTTASSYFSSDDFIGADKLKCNISPDDFEHIKVIGRGYFGKVTQVKFLKDDKIYALKSLKKAKLKGEKHIEHTKMERKILEIVQHPFIVSLKFAFQTPKKLYFVMDYFNGGELFYHLRSKTRFSEYQAKFYLAQILLAIEFLHSKKIIYRDLKPENVILDTNGYIKLTDFGLAKENVQEDSGCTQTFCGTPDYLAPEIIRGDKYGKGVDVWCMGIMLYEMLYGFPPFFDKNKDKLYKKIIFNEPDFSRVLSVKPSPEARDLIVRLLDKNQKSRPKFRQIKEHKFFDGLDFDALCEYKLDPPFIPQLQGENDYKYIDPSLANEKAEDSLYTGHSILGKPEAFDNFTYAENLDFMDK